MRSASAKRWLAGGLTALLVGALTTLLLVLWPRRIGRESPPPAQSTRNRPTLAPIVMACAGIVLVGAAWTIMRSVDASRTDLAVARALTGGEPAHAPALMIRYGCAGCHTIPGVPGADGQVGTTLSGLRKRVFIAGAVANTADNLIGWIVQPQRYAPETAMPETGISPAEARDVAAWLYAH